MRWFKTTGTIELYYWVDGSNLSPKTCEDALEYTLTNAISSGSPLYPLACAADPVNIIIDTVEVEGE